MKRVAALCLPMWPIERLRRAERRDAQPEPRAPAPLDPLAEAAAVEQAHACPVPRGGGWRPGARWAREEAAGKVALLATPILPGTGRGTARRSRVVEGAPLSAITTARGKRGPLHQPAAGPPPRSGEDLGPLVTSLRTGNRLVLGASCPRALALGLVPGMAVAQARAQVPGLDIRPADPGGDAAALRRLAVLAARRWSPIVAIEGADTLFLDLTGTAHLFGGEEAMAKRIVRLLARAGFSARIAVADTPGAAWALARHSPGVTICPPGRQGEAIAGLPATALRIEDKHVELLARLGVDTIGQLAAMPRAPLVRRFGAGLALRLAQALDEAPEPLDLIVPSEAVAVVQRFAEPIATPEAILHWLEALVAKLAVALEAAGLGASRVELIAERVDGVPQRIRLGLARPNRDSAHLLRLLGRRIEDVEPGYGVDSLALHVRRALPLGPEPVTERLDEEAAPDLAALVDTLATRIGFERIWRSRPVESDVPERSVARMPVLDPPKGGGARPKIDDVRRLGRHPARHPWHPEWPRPVRLLRRPERLDHVIAELPDHAPRRFTWRGQAHRVQRADGPERIHGEWWRHAAETHSVRDYFRVEDDAGRRYWLFRRGDGEQAETGDLSWYLHGVFG